MSVVQISARDIDLDNHGEFTYAIDPTNGPALYHFEINSLDGVLYLKNPIDYETYTSISFDMIGKWNISIYIHVIGIVKNCRFLFIIKILTYLRTRFCFIGASYIVFISNSQ